MIIYAYTLFVKKFWATTIGFVLLYLALSFFGTSLWALVVSQQQISDLQARVEIIKYFTEAIAIVIAGIWAYEVYIKNRYDYPYPKIRHMVKHYRLGNGYTCLSVFVTVTNEGKTKLDLSNGVIHVRKVLPISTEINNLILSSDIDDLRTGQNPVQVDSEENRLFRDQGQRVGWDMLGERTWKKNLRGKMHEFEPGQTREIQFDFLFLETVKVVEIISYFEFKKSGWEHVTLHSLKFEEDSIN